MLQACLRWLHAAVQPCPKASYTLLNPDVPEDYSPACIDWVSADKVDYNLMPPPCRAPPWVAPTAAALVGAARLCSVGETLADATNVCSLAAGKTVGS
jgi:hypothetical protein